MTVPLVSHYRFQRFKVFTSLEYYVASPIPLPGQTLSFKPGTMSVHLPAQFNVKQLLKITGTQSIIYIEYMNAIFMLKLF